MENPVLIRLATPDDAAACADIHVRSWLVAYSHCVPAEVLAVHNARRPSLWAKMLTNNGDSHYVITQNGKIIGITTLNPPRDQDLPTGTYELTGLYLDPAFIGQGVGKQTMAWIKKETIARGYDKLSLWVLDENHRAKAFYRACGFHPDGTRKESGLADRWEERWLCETI